MSKKEILFFTLYSLSFLLFFFLFLYVLAWQEPTQNPPGGNVFAPINVSDIAQGKLGSLGIGISTPLSRLHLRDGQSWGTDLSLDAQGTTGGRRWLLISTGGVASEGQGKFLIKDNNANQVRLTIDTQGNVGIGTTAPAYKLDVVGALRLQPSSAPTGANGVIYYDSSSNKFRCYQNGSWVDCITAAGASFPLLAPLGSATNPSYSFSGDTNTGIFSAGADILSFTTGGTERMRINSSGNIGIGTTNPAYRLDISGDVRWSGTLQGGSVPWQRLTSFPSACPSGQFVTAVGSTLNCATPSGGGGLTNAFTRVENTSGQTQFSASGADKLQFGAGPGLSLNFDATNKRITYNNTGVTNISTSGILQGGGTGNVTIQNKTLDCGVGKAIQKINSDGTLSCVSTGGGLLPLDGGWYKIMNASGNPSEPTIKLSRKISGNVYAGGGKVLKVTENYAFTLPSNITGIRIRGSANSTLKLLGASSSLSEPTWQIGAACAAWVNMAPREFKELMVAAMDPLYGRIDEAYGGIMYLDSFGWDDSDASPPFTGGVGSSVTWQNSIPITTFLAPFEGRQNAFGPGSAAYNIIAYNINQSAWQYTSGKVLNMTLGVMGKIYHVGDANMTISLELNVQNAGCDIEIRF
jgi:hypothetical protein